MKIVYKLLKGKSLIFCNVMGHKINLQDVKLLLS